jgi:hypothetical protein
MRELSTRCEASTLFRRTERGRETNPAFVQGPLFVVAESVELEGQMKTENMTRWKAGFALKRSVTAS